MSERVLVTGGSGFIGRHVVRRLLAQGMDVHAIARAVPAWSAVGLTWHDADLLSGRNVDEIVAAVGAARLIHLAWDVTPGSAYRSLVNLDWVAATTRLFRSFVEAGGQSAVVAGSCAEYDWSFDLLYEIETPLRPSTLYGASKLAASVALQAAAELHGIPLGWARIFFVYGPGENPARLVPSVIKALLEGRVAECSSGEQERDYMHVDDVAAALVHISESRYSGPVNVASGSCVPVRDIVLALGERMGRPELIKLGKRGQTLQEAPRLAAHIVTLTQKVAFKTSISLDAGLAQTIEWWEGYQKSGIMKAGDSNWTRSECSLT